MHVVVRKGKNTRELSDDLQKVLKKAANHFRKAVVLAKEAGESLSTAKTSEAEVAKKLVKLIGVMKKEGFSDEIIVGAVQGLIASFLDADTTTDRDDDPGDQRCVDPPSGLVSWWPGDGNAHDIVDDNDGTLVGGATFAPGKVKRAFSLNGVSAFVDFGNAPNLHVSGGDFTVDAWVNFNTLSHPPGANLSGTPQGDMSIVDKMANTPIDNSDGWRFIKQDDNRFWFCFGGGTSNGCTPGSLTTVMSSTMATVGVWFHVAAVKSANIIKIYVNGVLEAANVMLFGFTDTNATNLHAGNNVKFGAWLNGLIDEIEIYNRALTDAEILLIFAAGSAGKCRKGVRR